MKFPLGVRGDNTGKELIQCQLCEPLISTSLLIHDHASQYQPHLQVIACITIRQEWKDSGKGLVQQNVQKNTNLILMLG